MILGIKPCHPPLHGKKVVRSCRSLPLDRRIILYIVNGCFASENVGLNRKCGFLRKQQKMENFQWLLEVENGIMAWQGAKFCKGVPWLHMRHAALFRVAVKELESSHPDVSI